MTTKPRYDGRPLLRMVECYVLSSIGHLSDQQEHALSMMAPKISVALGVEGSWFEMIASHMGFPDHLPSKLRGIWEAGQTRADAEGLSVDPEEFARQLVDTNWPDLALMSVTDGAVR